MKFPSVRLYPTDKPYFSSYDPDSTNNDIALLKLKKKIDFSSFKGTVGPVCLPNAPRKYYGETVQLNPILTTKLH